MLANSYGIKGKPPKTFHHLRTWKIINFEVVRIMLFYILNIFNMFAWRFPLTESYILKLDYPFKYKIVLGIKLEKYYASVLFQPSSGILYNLD